MSTGRRNLSWLWAFLAFFGLAAVAIGILFWYNSSRLLTPERLAQARERWAANGPKDYDYTYHKRVGDSTNVDTFSVSVRDSKVKSVTFNKDQELPPSKLDYHDMPAMYRDIEVFLGLDSKPNSSSVRVLADFDANDGHLLRYIRSVVGTPERVEIAITSFKPLGK